MPFNGIHIFTGKHFKSDNMQNKLTNNNMILYVDETESDEYFIVAGLLVHSQKEINTVYSKFKKRANRYKISPKYKSKLFTEFKSTLLDKRFQKLKMVMLEELNTIEYGVYYCNSVKKDGALSQGCKERTYIQLLTNIVKEIRFDIDIIFDTFNKSDFENDIIAAIGGLDNVICISSCDSQISAGLQYVDNMCSIYRLHVSGKDNNNFYGKIKKYVRIV